MKTTHAFGLACLATLSFVLGYTTKHWKQPDPVPPTPPIESNPSAAKPAHVPQIVQRAQQIAEDSNKPLTRAELLLGRQREFHDSMVQEAALKSEPELRSQLSSYGLSESAIQDILDRRRKLHYEAIDAGELTTKLVNSRQEYDTELRKVLTPEKYLEYREFERTKRAEPAVAHLSKLADEAGTPFSKAGLEAAQKIFSKHLDSVRIAEYWHRPYDPLPHPNGGPSGAEEFRRERLLFNSARGDLLAEAVGSLSPSEYLALEALLKQHAETIDSNIRLFEMSREEAMKHIQKEAAKFRQRSRPTQP